MLVRRYRALNAVIAVAAAAPLPRCAAEQTAIEKPSGGELLPARPASTEQGRAVYRKVCASCHGESGDGRGKFARDLEPEPRDFTRAVYRYRSTPTGSLPREEDLVRVVLRGVPGTSMPAWRDHLSNDEVRDVVAYVKGFSPVFAEDPPDEPIAIPEPLPYSEASAARGKTVYETLECGRCHGKEGRGDGWGEDGEMKDSLGRVMRPRDFTEGIYRSGPSKRDIYRTLIAGLDGTPMPAYEGSVSADEGYDLVNYLLSLERPRGIVYWLFTRPRWYEPGEHEVAR